MLLCGVDSVLLVGFQYLSLLLGGKSFISHFPGTQITICSSSEKSELVHISFSVNKMKRNS